MRIFSMFFAWVVILAVLGVNAYGQGSGTWFVPGAISQSSVVREWTADTSLVCYFDGAQSHWVAVGASGTALQADMPAWLKVNDFEIDEDTVYFVGQTMASLSIGIVGRAKIKDIFAGLPFDCSVVPPVVVGGNANGDHYAHIRSLDKMDLYRDANGVAVVAFLGSSDWEPDPPVLHPRVYGLTSNAGGIWQIELDLNKDEVQYYDIAVTDKYIALPFSEPDSNNVCIRVVPKAVGLAQHHDVKLGSDRVECGHIAAAGLDGDHLVIGYRYPSSTSQSPISLYQEPGVAMVKVNIESDYQVTLADKAHMSMLPQVSAATKVVDIRYSAAFDRFGLLATLPVLGGVDDVITEFDNAGSLANTRQGNYEGGHVLHSFDMKDLSRFVASGTGNVELWHYRMSVPVEDGCLPVLETEWRGSADQLVGFWLQSVVAVRVMVPIPVSCTSFECGIKKDCQK